VVRMPLKANLEAPLYELPSRSVVAMLSGVRLRMVVETMRRRIGDLTCTSMWKIQVEEEQHWAVPQREPRLWFKTKNL